MPNHEERCTNARNLIGSFNLMQLFGENGNGGIPLHTILDAGLVNLADNSAEKAAAEVMVAALAQSDDTKKMLYRDFFTKDKGEWKGTNAQKDVIIKTFRGDANKDVSDHFALPHAQHIKNPDKPDIHRMARMGKIIKAILEDDGAKVCTPLRLLTLNEMERHINYNVRQFYLMKAARDEGLLTEDPPRGLVAGEANFANNRCATFDTSSLAWNCNTEEPGAKCTLIDGVPSLLTNICD